MGKGQRTKKLRIEQKQIEEERITEEKKKRRRLAIAAISSFLCVAILTSVIILWVDSSVNSGKSLRKTIVIESETYDINNAMMTCFFNISYRQFIDQNSSYLEYMGLDASKSPKSQMYDDTTTWFDYVMKEYTVPQVEDYLIFAEAAVDAGISLTAEENDNIDEIIGGIAVQAEAADMDTDDYIAERYGRGIKEEDIRACMELIQLSGKYYEQIQESFVYSDSELEQYYSENQSLFLYCDYLIYTFEDITDEAELNNLTDELAKCKTQESFTKWVYDYVLAAHTHTDECEDGHDAPAETVSSLLTEQFALEDDEELSEWLFEGAHEIGDTVVIDDSVYMLIKNPYRREEITKNLREIFISYESSGSEEDAKETAEYLLGLWKEGDATAKSFAELAQQYSESTDTADNGGIQENVAPDELDTELRDWVFSGERQSGDTVLYSSDYGCYIIYFEGDGMIAWKNEVTAEKSSQEYEEIYNSLREKHTFTLDTSVLEKIPIGKTE